MRMGDATKEELLAGILRRLSDIFAGDGTELLEACLPAYDTYTVTE